MSNVLVAVNGRYVDTYSPIDIEGEVIVGIDPSKTNTAIYVESWYNPSKNFDIEITIPSTIHHINGSWEVRTILKKLLKNCKVKSVAIEDVVTVKKEEEAGYRKINLNDLHKVRIILTFIFSSFVIFCQEFFKVNPMIVNNSEWKSEVIPHEYNKKSSKGSKLWLEAINHRLGSRSNDVTDAYCIVQYIRKRLKRQGMVDTPLLDQYVPYDNKFEFYLVNSSYIKEHYSLSSLVKFNVKDITSVSQIAQTICNNIDYGEAGVTVLNVNSIELEDIYEYYRGDYVAGSKFLYVLVRR